MKLKTQYLLDKKMSLVKDGNFFRYHFIDIDKSEFDTWDTFDFIRDRSELDDIIISVLQVDRIVKYSGIIFLIRFKDVLQHEESDKAQLRDKINAEIRDLYEHPPLWASIYRDEYNGIISRVKVEDELLKSIGSKNDLK